MRTCNAMRTFLTWSQNIDNFFRRADNLTRASIPGHHTFGDIERRSPLALGECLRSFIVRVLLLTIALFSTINWAIARVEHAAVDGIANTSVGGVVRAQAISRPNGNNFGEIGSGAAITPVERVEAAAHLIPERLTNYSLERILRIADVATTKQVDEIIYRFLKLIGIEEPQSKEAEVILYKKLSNIKDDLLSKEVLEYVKDRT